MHAIVLQIFVYSISICVLLLSSNNTENYNYSEVWIPLNTPKVRHPRYMYLIAGMHHYTQIGSGH